MSAAVPVEQQPAAQVAQAPVPYTPAPTAGGGDAVAPPAPLPPQSTILPAAAAAPVQIPPPRVAAEGEADIPAPPPPADVPNDDEAVALPPPTRQPQVTEAKTAAFVPEALSPEELTLDEQDDERESTDWMRGAKFLLEVVLRFVFAPIVAIFELFIATRRFFPHQRLPGILILVGVCLSVLQFVLFLSIKTQGTELPVELEVPYVIILILHFLIVAFVLFKIVAQHWHMASSLLVRDANSVSSGWTWFIVSWIRILVEGAQVALIPLLFVPMDASRGDGGDFSAWVDWSGSRYSIVNIILLRSFPSTPEPTERWVPDLSNATGTVWETPVPSAWTTDSTRTGLEYAPGNGVDQTFYVMTWPAIILLYWIFTISQSATLKAYFLGDTVTSWQIHPARIYPDPKHRKHRVSQEVGGRDILPAFVYQGFLHLQHELISLEGPFSTMLLLFAGQFLVDWHNRVPHGLQSSSPGSQVGYQGAGVMLAMSVFSFYYLIPALMMDEICDQRRVEVPFFRLLRGILKAVVILSTCLVAGGGINTENRSSVRSVLISLTFLCFHCCRIGLVSLFRPSPLASLNLWKIITSAFGISMSLTALILVGQANPANAGKGSAVILCIFGGVALMAIVWMVVRHSVARKALPEDDGHPQSGRRQAVVSGLRLYSSATIGGGSSTTGGSSVVQGHCSQLIKQVLWRPMEPFQIFCVSEDEEEIAFVTRLVTESKIPGNVRGHPSWMLTVQLGLRALIPQLSTAMQLNMYVHVMESFLGKLGEGGGSAASQGVHVQVLRSLCITSSLTASLLNPAAWMSFFLNHSLKVCSTVFSLHDAKTGEDAPILGGSAAMVPMVGGAGTPTVWSVDNANPGGQPTVSDGGPILSSNLGPDAEDGEAEGSALEHLVSRVMALSEGLVDGQGDRSAVALMEAAACLATTLRLQVTAFCQLFLLVSGVKVITAAEKQALFSLELGGGLGAHDLRNVAITFQGHIASYVKAAEGLALLSRTCTRYWKALTPEAAVAQQAVRKAWSSVGRDLLQLREALISGGTDQTSPFLASLLAFPNAETYPNSAALIRDLEQATSGEDDAEEA